MDMALYAEEKDSVDGLAYYYVAFQVTTTGRLHFLKIGMSDLKIVWNYDLYYGGTTNRARFMFPDPALDRQFYLMGSIYY